MDKIFMDRFIFSLVDNADKKMDVWVADSAY